MRGRWEHWEHVSGGVRLRFSRTGSGRGTPASALTATIPSGAVSRPRRRVRLWGPPCPFLCARRLGQEEKAQGPTAGKGGPGCDLCLGSRATSTQTGKWRQKPQQPQLRALPCGRLCPLTPALPEASPRPLVRAGRWPLCTHVLTVASGEGPVTLPETSAAHHPPRQRDLWPFPRPTAHRRKGISQPFRDMDPGGPSITC